MDQVCHTKGRRCSAPFGTVHSGSVSFVNQKNRVMLLGNSGEIRQRSEVAIHTEDAIGRDQTATKSTGVSLQTPIELVGVVVRIDPERRPRQLGAIDQTGMVEAVEVDCIPFADQSRNGSQVGGV